MMSSSTLASGDALQFYYDNNATPLVINTVQPSTGAAESFLGPVRYLDDGTEQVLLQPRKDTAGTYDPTAQTLSPYGYAPYGAPLSPAPASAGLSSDDGQYDLAQNPYQYTGEYRDPTCETYYLRARWYLPAQQTFLSRDPGDPLHRYSYTAGNPVGRTDPSGLHGVEAGARHFLDSLDADRNGPAGAASRFFLGSALGIAQILANPSGYWQQLKHDKNGIDIFLGAGIALELGTSGWGPLPELPGSYRASFAGRHLFDFILGAGQSVANGLHGRRLDWAAVGQGLEYTAGGIVEARELLGFGYKPYNLTSDDVEAHATEHFQGGRADADILVYRVRSPLFRVGPVFGRGPWSAPQFTSPLLELGHLGFYHETVVGVLNQWDWDAQDLAPGHYEISIEPIRAKTDGPIIHERVVENRAGVRLGPQRRAAFVGTYQGKIETFLKTAYAHRDDDDFLTRRELMDYWKAHRQFPTDPYFVLGNNCQTFAGRIRKNLGVP
jgi:RHS repeat-associated protein